MGDVNTTVGDPASIQAVGNDAQQAVSTLDQLQALVNSDVTDTVPDRWGGAAAGSFDHLWYRFAAALAGLGSPLGNYAEALRAAATTMNNAKQLLQKAKDFCDSHGLYPTPELTVKAIDEQRPDAEILRQTGQAMLNAAVQAAEQARQQIRTANAKLEQDAANAQRELLEIVMAMNMGGGRRGRGRKAGGRPPGRGSTEDLYERQKRWYEGPEQNSKETINSGKNNVAVNKNNEPYPQIIDPRTGKPVEFPQGPLTKVPESQQSPPLDNNDRAQYWREYFGRGNKLPPGYTTNDYDLHHIRPREYGGTNDYDNLVPLRLDVHQEEFSNWWKNY
jgi:uncharacterized protein YukE